MHSSPRIPLSENRASRNRVSFERSYVGASCTSLQQNLFIRAHGWRRMRCCILVVIPSRYHYPASVRTDRFDRFYFSFLRTMIPLFENERGLVGYLLKIGFLFHSRIVDLRGTHEHSRSIKSPLANGTRVDREEEGGVFFSFLKNDIVSKIRIDFFFSPLSFLPSSLRVLLNVRVTFAPRCGGGDEHRVELER